MSRMSVAVLRGGESNEYDLSLKTGAAMLAALPEEKYEAHDILVDRSGQWHSRGLPTTPSRALQQVDVVLNALHGGKGEDGTTQRFLESVGVPYAGSRPFGASAAMNKIRTHELLDEASVRMPLYVAFSHESELSAGEMAREVFSRFGPPYILKPPRGGGSEGIRLATTIVDLPEALADMLDVFGIVLVEEFVRGIPVSVGILQDFRDQPLYALPPAEARLPKDDSIIENRHHEENLIRHIAPSNFTHAEKRYIEELAKQVHAALQLDHFSRIDLIKTPKQVYVLEANAIPGLYPGASMPIMLQSVGSSVPQFLEHSISLARARK